MKRFFILLVLLLWFLVPPRASQAYEYEHYAWTYYLALHVGYTERQAFQIASATYSIDWAPDTSPMPFGKMDEFIALAGGVAEANFRGKWRRLHAFGSKSIIDRGRKNGLSVGAIKVQLAEQKQKDELVLWNQGLKARNPGPFMHFLQDRGPHSDWADLFGHGPANHLPDFFSADRAKAYKMTHDTIAALLRFKTKLCVSAPLEFCNHPFKQPNKRRIEKVLEQLINVNKMPSWVNYSPKLDRALKALSLSYDQLKPNNLVFLNHSSFRTHSLLDRKTLFMAALGIASNLQRVLRDNGASAHGRLSDVNVKDWLTTMPGPEKEKTHRVITDAILHDKANPSRNPLLQPIRKGSAMEAYGGINAKLPFEIFQYSYNGDATPRGNVTSFTLEDLRIKLPDRITVKPSAPIGDFPHQVFKAKIDFKVKLEGMAPPLGFLDKLPTMVVSTPEFPFRITAPKVEYKLLDDANEIHMKHEVEWKVEDVQGKELDWAIKVEVYGQKPIERHIPVKFEEVSKPSCNSKVQQGGDAGGGVEVDLKLFTGKAGFSWQMHNIKDEMTVSLNGGPTQTTGCVSHTGTFVVDIPTPGSTAKVAVVPNCQGNTSGTKWSFVFECPLASDITADGQGNALNPDGTPADTNSSTASSGAGTGTMQQFDGLTGSTSGMIKPTGTLSPVGEIEVNNNAATATMLPPSADISGNIDKARDADFYSFDAKAAGEWEITIGQNTSAGSIGLGARNAAGGNWLADTTKKGDGKIVVDLKSPGKYVLQVKDTQRAAGPRPYKVTARFRQSPDNHEPNGNAATAKQIAASGKLVGAILPAGDSDFYYVDVARSGEWTIENVAKPDGMELGLGVRDAAGGNWFTDRSPPGDGKLVVDLRRPGKYILRAVEKNKARSVDPYVLDLKFIASPDRHEPNASAATAATINPSGAIVGTILPLKDADFYAIDAPQAGEWSITVADAPKGMKIGLNVRAAAGGNWLADNTPKGDDKLVVDLKRPGQYVLRATDTNGVRSVEPYKLDLVMTPAPDTHEPNDSAGLAAAGQLNQTITGAILPRKDADFFIYDVTKPGQWEITALQTPPGMKLGLGVRNAAGGNWFTDNSPKGDGKIVIDIKWPGKYVIRVTDDNRTRSVKPYQVQSRFSAAPDAHEPNDNAALAARITPNGTITGAILPKKDADFFVIDAPGKGIWSIQVRSKPAAMDIGLGVRSAAGGNWFTDKSPKGDGELVVEIPDKGKFVLRAFDSHGSRSVEPYVLTTSFQ